MHALLKSSNETPITIERQLKLISHVNPVLSHSCRRRLRYMHMRSFDWKQGGLLSPVKFIDRDSVEYSLVVATDHEKSEARMACLTLDNAMSLVDPEWGGVYQYSTQGKWDVPHYRKTIAAQAGHLRLYSLAYAQLKLDRYLNVTNSILSYTNEFITSNVGAFYSGQADSITGTNPKHFFSLDKTRRYKLGIPDIDKRILTRENGWMIEALATHYEYCGSQQSLEMVIKAAAWVNTHCRLDTGAYLKSIMARKPVHLSDTLAMARAMLQLYRATFDTNYLDFAYESTEFIYKNFKNDLCGYNSGIISKNGFPPVRQIDENISLTRFTNLLFYISGNALFNKMTAHGLRYLCIPEVATARVEEAGILLLDRETLSPPLIINIEGKHNDSIFNEFINIAQRYPGWYKLIKIKHADSASASIEIDKIKSKPVKTPEKLNQLLINH